MKNRAAGIVFGALLLGLLALGGWSLWFARELPPPQPGDLLRNGIGMELIFVPPGEFLMGSPEGEPQRDADERSHRVKLTRGFYLGKYEVTRGEFARFVAETGFRTEAEQGGLALGMVPGEAYPLSGRQYSWKNPGFEQTERHPAVEIARPDADAFCQWPSQREQKTYRLPTEAEWEYACRAGSSTAFAFGDDPAGLTLIANIVDATARAAFSEWNHARPERDGFVFTAPVGSFRPNAFGLYDLHGNVWEWVADRHADYPVGPVTNPLVTKTGGDAILRGGSYLGNAWGTRSANRSPNPSLHTDCSTGFRVVLDLAPGK